MKTNKTAMFYDGGCPLCAKEVAHYRRIDSQNSVDWLDIDVHPETLSRHGISHDEAMKHLHVLNTEGEIVKGAYAFHALWAVLPRYRYFARICSLPGFLWLMDKVYGQFAKRRYASRMACASKE